MSPKKQQDWLLAGMQLLVQFGAPGLSIERLCQALHVSKGSFYHHFKGVPDFNEKLLAYWQHLDTQTIKDQLQVPGPQGSPLDKLLFILASRPPEAAHAEIAIRAWAMQDPLVRACVAQVDADRLALLNGILHQMGYDPTQSSLMASMLYSMLVGCYSVIPPVAQERLAQLYTEFKRAFVIP
jgi:AcrR family transcriptional regulator